MKKIAVVATSYRTNSHADVIVTKFLTGYPTDEGLVQPKVTIASMYFDQPEDSELGRKIADKFGVAVYPTIREALTLGGQELAVDGVIYAGVHGQYPHSRLGVTMVPQLNHLDQVFRVLDASKRAVPVYCDRELGYSWLDSKWIYDRAQELGAPMMAGSSLPLAWTKVPFEQVLGRPVAEAISIGHGPLLGYGFHAMEALQCMLERRRGGETGVTAVQALQGPAVYEAAEAGLFSMELAEAGCSACSQKKPGTMREHDKAPQSLLIHYTDGTRGAVVMAGHYVGECWSYAASMDGETIVAEFVLHNNVPYSHFSYLDLNIERMFLTGKPQLPLERTLLTSGLLDAAARSLHAGGKLIETPHLNVCYQPYDFEPLRPTSPAPTGASIGPWPPAGVELPLVAPRARKTG